LGGISEARRKLVASIDKLVKQIRRQQQRLP
jgi:hypothetical protein